MDNAKIHRIQHLAEDLAYSIAETKEFVWESNRLLLYDFAKTDWNHAHIAKRSITFGGVIYRIKSTLENTMIPPLVYFG